MKLQEEHVKKKKKKSWQKRPFEIIHSPPRFFCSSAICRNIAMVWSSLARYVSSLSRIGAVLCRCRSATLSCFCFSSRFRCSRLCTICLATCPLSSNVCFEYLSYLDLSSPYKSDSLSSTSGLRSLL